MTTASSSSPLFTIPVPAQGKQPAGSITCTQPAPRVYLLTLNIPPDNRLTTASCAALLEALDRVKFGSDSRAGGVLVTTSAITKFYSNGLDLEHALATPTFLPLSLYPLFLRFLTYPMPTIALLNGHAFAGGLMLAMHHDYRVQNPARGFACVNELEFGVPLKPAMSAVFRLKLSPVVYRHLVLEARRFGGPAALEAGIVDALGGMDDVLALVKGRDLTGKARTGVYGALKREMYRESVALLTEEGHVREEERVRREEEVEEVRREKGRRKVEAKL